MNDDLPPEVHARAATIMQQAVRWNYCIRFGFPVRNQNPATTGPTWTAYGPGNIRGQGYSPDEAVDDAIRLTPKEQQV